VPRQFVSHLTYRCDCALAHEEPGNRLVRIARVMGRLVERFRDHGSSRGRPVHGSYLSNIGLQCVLSRPLLARMQATIRRTFGISAAQSLNTSGVHAARSAAVWAKPGVGNAVNQTAIPRMQPSPLTLAHGLICVVPISVSFPVRQAAMDERI
jgi:hypothetical protein